LEKPLPVRKANMATILDDLKDGASRRLGWLMGSER